MARQPPNFDTDALIFQYQHDTGRPKADEALLTLRKIGSVVKPIMRQRAWKVGTLAEFYPTQGNLLGMNTNRGQMVQLRLRHPGDHTQFLPFESVVDTMLHELCHNVIGPHNQQFHALWEQLREEHESLLRKGYTGEGFLGQGQMLGGGRRLPRQEANRLARQAAEQRRVRNQGSGQRLGGTGILRGQDARAVIADTVERRLKIERGCASGTEAGEQVARDEAGKGSMATTEAGPTDENEETMMQAYIDLIQEEEREKFGGYYEAPSAANPAGPRGSQGRGQTLLEQQKEIELGILKDQQKQKQQQDQDKRSKQASRPQTKPTHPPTPQQPNSNSGITPNPSIRKSTKTITTNNHDPSKPSPSNPPPLQSWTCEICTLINPLTYLSCDACGIERPDSISHTHNNDPEPSTSISSARPTHPALAPRSSAYDSISRFTAERERKVASTPMGWRCGGCGNFMESEWWTCARCGRMKEQS